MSLIKYSLVVLTIAFVTYKWHTGFQPRELPKLNNQWWGPGQKKVDDSSIRPFKVVFSKEMIDDLKNRLDNHRPFTPPLENVAQEYGMNTDLLKDVVDFWRKDYDFKERENYLNKYPQFKTNVQGLEVHYIHVKPVITDKTIKILPLLILHGWPGSVREFYEIIPLLTQPQNGKKFAFEVIVPHLPGFGFSDAAAKPGLGPAQMAEVFRNLMQRLGFNKYYIQGGDFGAIVLQYMAALYPKNVLGFHSNMCTNFGMKAMIKQFIGQIYPSWIVKPEHYDRVYPLGAHFQWRIQESGYLHLQATKPDTLGVGVGDSPAGLAAYVLEKFTTGTNRDFQARKDGGLKEHFTYTDLIDNLMIYWVSGSVTTTFRLYSETFNKAVMALDAARPVLVPSACARFKYDFYSPDTLLYDIYNDLVQITDYEGGHFAAFQVPEVLAGDIFEAVDKFRIRN